MKSKLIILALSLFVWSAALAQLPPEIKGENFQRPTLLDCQTFWVERFPGVHLEIKQTTCFYRAEIAGIGPLPRFITLAITGNKVEILNK